MSDAEYLDDPAPPVSTGRRIAQFAWLAVTFVIVALCFVQMPPAWLNAQRLLDPARYRTKVVDVFDPEIPPADHPLLKCENAILSPHNAAQTAEARLNYAAVVLDLLRVLDGKRPAFTAREQVARKLM